MLIKNIKINSYDLINGDLGYVIDFNDNYPIVKFDRFPEVSFTIKSYKWEIIDQNFNPVIIIEQIPLSLGWALTVHKSQGLTLNKVIIYFNDITFPGQAYVALSRVKTINNLKCIGFNSKKIKVNQTCINFYNLIKKYN